MAARQGHEAILVREAGLLDADDLAIWQRAALDGASIVTKDEDFAMLAGLSPGPKVLWVRTGNLVNRFLLARFEQAWPEILAHLAAGAPLIELR